MPSRLSRPSASSIPTSPLISVIVPVYNVAEFLERCVSSILAQTYQNLEIFLVDDGSTDASGEMCDAFAQKDSRVKVIHQRNLGLSGARNSALKLASGDFIIFIDSDDDVHPDLISCLYTLCHTHHSEIAICSSNELAFDAPTPVATSLPCSTKVLIPLTTLATMLCETDFSMSAWGKLYAASLFENDPFATSKPLPIRFPDGKLHEDVGTTYKLVLNSQSIAFTPEKLYNYRQNPSSITKQSFSPRKLDLIALTDEMCDNLEAWAREQPPDVQSQIQNLTKKRRAHARFSVLRQMVLVDPKSLPVTKLQDPAEIPAKTSDLTRHRFLQVRREIVKYLRQHKHDVLKNPLASRRDRLAVLSLLAGLPVFKCAWLTYQKHKTQQKPRSHPQR